MKRKKRPVCAAVLLLILMAALMSGCSRESAPEKKEESSGGYDIYYLNKEGSAVQTAEYVPQSEDTEDMIDEFLEQLAQSPENTDLQPVLDAQVQISSYELENMQLSLHFDPAYQKLLKTREILCRSAIVRTLCQIPQVESVSFLIGDSPLMDSKQTPIGPMTQESFVENMGDDLNTYTVATVDLYFANESGDKLVDELLEIRYSSSMSVERLVLEQLIRGPVTDDVYPTIPPETKIISVSTKDGICYVNLDNGFLGQGYNVTEAVPIFSIVNSLTAIPGISKVQIMINGETDLVYRESIRFDTIFERNLDIIETEKE